MVLDKNTMFSEDQAITVSAPSTNVLDLGALGKAAYSGAQLKHNVGNKHIPLLIQVTQNFATLTSLTIAVESDDNSGFATPKQILAQTVAVAELKQGFKSAIRSIPVVKERYIRINYTVTGLDATAGKITAGLALAVDSDQV